jgi:hypothetical protein
MNKRTVFGASLMMAVLLLPGISYARRLNVNTGRFHTMDTYEGNQQDPQSLHRFTYCQNDPVNNVDPSGNEIEGVLTVMDISSGFLAAISPATSKAKSAAATTVLLPNLPTDRNTQLLVGLIFAESSSKNWGGGDNEDEKIEMGLTVLNRSYYAKLRAPNGRNYNTRFGDGTVLGALQISGEFVAYGGNRWNQVMTGTSLKSKAELDRLQVFEKDHLRLSIDAANFCNNGNPPPPTGLATVGGIPGQFPVAFNKANNQPPSPRMVKFVHVGSHSFYSFVTGREAQ